MTEKEFVMSQSVTGFKDRHRLIFENEDRMKICYYESIQIVEKVISEQKDFIDALLLVAQSTVFNNESERMFSCAKIGGILENPAHIRQIRLLLDIKKTIDVLGGSNNY